MKAYQRITIAVAALVVGALIWWLQYSSPYDQFSAYFGIASAVAVALVVLTRGRLQNALLVVASVFITTALGEVAVNQYRRFTTFTNPSAPLWDGKIQFYTRDDARLGTVMSVTSTKIHAERLKDGRKLYDVSYTIDEHGRRVTKGNPESQCSYLFLGDSFVFGVGLNDEDTLPQRFSQGLDYRFNVANLGVPGSGPHDLLRAIDLDRIAYAAKGRIAGAYMTLITDHILRARGLQNWTRFGPRYILDKDGHLVSAGRFDRLSGRFDSFVEFRRDLVGLLRASNLFEAMYGYPELDDPREMEYARAVLIAIMVRVKDVIKERYGAPLTVIAADDGTGQIYPIIDALRARGVDAIDRDRLIAGPWTTDYIIAGDGHPSARANREIAASLAGRRRDCE